MSLSQRTEMRRCGRRYATEAAARCSKRGLQDGAMVIPCALGCEGWHVALPKAAPAAKTATRRDTGPDRLTRETVLARDGWACVCCGVSVIGRQYSLQHRKARGVGGGNSTANLITMLGSATTECHGRVESKRDPHDHGRGYRLESWEDPALVPVMIFDASGGGVTKWLTDDGEYADSAPGEAAA